MNFKKIFDCIIPNDGNLNKLSILGHSKLTQKVQFTINFRLEKPFIFTDLCANFISFIDFANYNA